jgi:hypothetical protein
MIWNFTKHREYFTCLYMYIHMGTLQYLIVCRKSFGRFSGRDPSSSREFFPGPTNHKQNPPRSQLMSKMDLVVTYAFLAPSYNVQVHALMFFSRNRANLKPETLNPGLFCKTSKKFSCGMSRPSTDLIQFPFSERFVI